MSSNAKKRKTKRRFIPVTRWHEYHDWPPLGGLRHLIFNADTNGFNKVIRRCGRRVLLDEDSFFEWVEEQNNEEIAPRRTSSSI